MHESVSTNPQRPPPSESICTLFEGDYHMGLAALTNSLVHAGYKGTVWVGYRGALPPWLDQLNGLDRQGAEYMVAGQIRLVFLLLETEIHFTSYKPQFMLDLFAGQARDSNYLWYFDPDIFLRCSWSFFLPTGSDMELPYARKSSPTFFPPTHRFVMDGWRSLPGWGSAILALSITTLTAGWWAFLLHIRTFCAYGKASSRSGKQKVET